MVGKPEKKLKAVKRGWVDTVGKAGNTGDVGGVGGVGVCLYWSLMLSIMSTISSLSR